MLFFVIIHIEIRSKIIFYFMFHHKYGGVLFLFNCACIVLDDLGQGVWGFLTAPNKLFLSSMFTSMCVQCTEFYKTSFGLSIYDLRSSKDRVHVVTLLCCCFLVATTLRKRQISALFMFVLVNHF